MKRDIVEVRKSGIQGKGVFALRDVKKGEKVFLFSDDKMEIHHAVGCDCAICRRCIQIGEFDWLYPAKDSFGWNLNHACIPTCGFQKGFIVAMKAIKVGEEIAIDYSMTNTDNVWKMECSCGSSDCRKIIRSVQFLPLNLFNKYKSFMPWYVEKNYR